MPVMLEGWTKEVSEARKMPKRKAEQFVIEHVRFLAEYEGRAFTHSTPVEDLGVDPMDQEDRAPCQIPVQHYPIPTAEPLVTHAAYPNKGGRPIEANLKSDKRIFDAWTTGKKNGTYKSYAELAEALGKSRKEVELAIDRHKKRERRKLR
jgi:hypothetical protein